MGTTGTKGTVKTLTVIAAIACFFYHTIILRNRGAKIIGAMHERYFNVAVS